jgi:hypothetical protein
MKQNYKKNNKQIQHSQESLKIELLKSIIKPISFEVYEKSNSERSIAKSVILNHKRELREAGINPKKQMNLAKTQTIKVL